MKLAAHHRWSLRDLHARMDSAEVVRWMAYDRLHPLSDPWEETALLAALIWNLAGKTTRGNRSPADFIPRAQRPKSGVQPAGEAFAMMAAIVAKARAKQGGE